MRVGMGKEEGMGERLENGGREKAGKGKRWGREVSK